MMAKLGAGPYKFADIASELNVNMSNLSPIRSNLIKKGMIYSPTYGNIDFTVPLFNEFMVRKVSYLT
jgi:Mn-dependent DtxR family transcriptional regulator